MFCWHNLFCLGLRGGYGLRSNTAGSTGMMSPTMKTDRSSNIPAQRDLVNRSKLLTNNLLHGTASQDRPRSLGSGV